MSVRDLITAAFNKDAASFEDTLNVVMQEKMAAAVQARFSPAVYEEEIDLDESKDDEDEDDDQMCEDVEELDELSKKTLASYTKKAADSMGNAAHSLGKKSERADEVDRMTNRHMPDKYNVRDNLKKSLDADEKSQRKDRHTIGKRIVGISQATDRLSK